MTTHSDHVRATPVNAPVMTRERSAPVRLEMSVNQAAAVATALDMFLRMSLGQFDEIARNFAMGVFKIASRDTDQGRIATEEECCNLRSICANLNRVAGHPYGGSFGIGSRAVGDSAHAAYEVMKVVRGVLAEHKDPNPSFRSVDYDGLTVRYTREPTPVCSVFPGANGCADRHLPPKELPCW